MPKEKQQKQLSVDTLRHSEYYDMQGVFDDLYARSRHGEVFTHVSEIIFSRNNILLAYRNLKTNRGGNTPGTDNLTIRNVGGSLLMIWLETCSISPRIIQEDTGQDLFAERKYQSPTVLCAHWAFHVYGIG